MNNIPKQLFQQNLIDEKQFELFEAIRSRKIVSVYHELRLILYIGILLFTGGVGYFAYQNIGEIGHLFSMFLMGVAIAVCFFFIHKFAKPYSNQQVTVKQVYFDYILILAALLIISLFTYIQVYFNLTAVLINWSSYISSAILLTMAYRYDNRGLLSMGITAFAAAVGVSITPVDWAQGEWLISTNLYVTSILLGAILFALAEVFRKKEIKAHFGFTYQNFGLLLYFVGCIAAIFDSHSEFLYALLLSVSGGVLSYHSWKRKAFLFFLYSNIASFIGFTYLLVEFLDSFNDGYIFLFYYFPISCLVYILLLIKNKSHFAND